MNFNDRLRKLRISRGLTLLQIAQSVGVSEATVQRWESGNIRTLHHDRVALLAEALGTTPSYLMGWDDPDAFTRQSVSDLTDDANAASDPAPAGVYLTDHERAVVEAYRARPDMQAAVDVLLGVPAETAADVKRA